MSRPEGSPGLSEPREQAAANQVNIEYLAFYRHGREDDGVSEPIVTPEGYDVSTVSDAEAYLTEVHGRHIRPISTGHEVMEALRHEPRAAMYLNGSRQSVTNHTYRLMDLCRPYLASRTNLNSNMAKTMIITHDWIEVFARDTVISDPVAMASKYYREAAGWTLLRHYLPADDLGLMAAEAYQQPGTLEEHLAANFVNSFDKIEAYNFQLRPDVRATLHRERREDYEEIVRDAIPKAMIDPTAARLMPVTLEELGRNWVKWGCKPFRGDPADIVRREVDRAIQARTDKQPNVWRLPVLKLIPGLGPVRTPLALKEAGIPILATMQHGGPSLQPPSPAVA